MCLGEIVKLPELGDLMGTATPAKQLSQRELVQAFTAFRKGDFTVRLATDYVG